jgi:hypothetical protein
MNHIKKDDMLLWQQPAQRHTPLPAPATCDSRHAETQEPQIVGSGSPFRSSLVPAPYVTIPLAACLTGLTEKAIRRKIEDGKWLDGREYRRSPDGGIFISIKGFQAWIEKGSGT